ncbi:MAG: sulfite exporter TauE/SafE family protein [Alphaproteobacteria bacterium]
MPYGSVASAGHEAHDTGMIPIYLPIAEMSVAAELILMLGLGVGLISGLFGIGGGFLMMPMLLFMGIPPAIAVGSQANQLVAASVSGAAGYFRQRQLDLKLGGLMLVGGFVGTACGVVLFGWLQRLGQIDVVIALSYVVFLLAIGGLMLAEAVKAMIRTRKLGGRRAKLHKHTWLHGLPFKMRFPASRLYISALLPLLIGFFNGVVVSVMGIGGGFLLIPLMIYVIGMPAALVAGTSLFQIVFTTALATFLQAVLNNAVDVVLAMLLLIGSVVGAQIGARWAGKLKAETARLLLGLIVLGVGGALAWDLVTPPEVPFTLELEW